MFESNDSSIFDPTVERADFHLKCNWAVFSSGSDKRGVRLFRLRHRPDAQVRRWRRAEGASGVLADPVCFAAGKWAPQGVG